MTAKFSLWRAFLKGLASIGEGLSFFGPRHTKPYEEMFGTDAEQIKSDWEKVGGDLKKAIEEHEKTK
jgi:hypothetical protein